MWRSPKCKSPMSQKTCLLEYSRQLRVAGGRLRLLLPVRIAPYWPLVYGKSNASRQYQCHTRLRCKLPPVIGTTFRRLSQKPLSCQVHPRRCLLKVATWMPAKVTEQLLRTCAGGDWVAPLASPAPHHAAELLLTCQVVCAPLQLAQMTRHQLRSRLTADTAHSIRPLRRQSFYVGPMRCIGTL